MDRPERDKERRMGDGPRSEAGPQHEPAFRHELFPAHWGGVDPSSTLFELAPVAYVFFDVEQRQALANRQALLLFGMPPQPAAWLDFEHLAFAEDDHLTAGVSERLARGEIDRFEVDRRLYRVDGSVFHCHLQTTRLEVSDGVTLLLVALEDISERVEAARAVAESEARFRALVQHAADTVVLLDGEGIVRYVSPSGADLIGEPIEQLIGRPVLEFVADEDREVAAEALVHTLVTPGAGNLLPLQVVRRDGTIRRLEVVSNNLLDDPSVGGIVMNVRDITDVTEARSALASSEHRVRHMLENISDTVLLLDAEANVLMSTGNLKPIMGYTPEFWDGRNGFDLLHPDDHEWVHAALEHLLANPGLELTGEVRTIAADGGFIDAELSAVNLLEDPHVRAIVLTTRNITDRKRSERELAEARDDAVQALQARTEFIANVSHELRTPIHGILGLSELLASADLDDDARGLARSIGRATDALRMVLDDVLDFAKIEVGRLEVSLQPIDVIEMADDIYGLFLPQAEAKGIELTRSLERGFPHAVMSDPLRVRQVLHNLIGNAIKFTEHGSVHVELRRDAVRSDGKQRLRLTVTDTGIGIPPEAHGVLFQPFSQVHPGTVRELGGTGLGLSIAQRLVDLLGGELGFESTLGEGSSFWFVLPLIEAPVDRLRGGDDAAPARAARVGTAALVLVVEDNPINQLLVRRQLERLGYESLVVDSGLEALEVFPDSGAAVVLMDWQLPGIDGLETTRRLRMWEVEHQRPRTPIVAMTASALPGDRERCLHSGMDDFLAKPVSIHTLGEMLHLWAPTAELPTRDRPSFRFAPARVAAESPVDRTNPIDVTRSEPRPSAEPAAPTGDRFRSNGNGDVGRAIEVLLDELADPLLVESVVRTYLRELPGRLAGLRAARLSGSADSLVGAAHLLKSTSQAVGASHLADLCASIEADARRDPDERRCRALDLTEIDDEATRAASALELAIARFSEARADPR